MKYKVVIPGKLANLNDYLAAERIRVGNRYGKFETKGNKLKQDTQKYILPYISQALKGKKIREPIKLHYHFFEPDKKRDLDNIASFCMKVFQDSMVKGGFISNDGWSVIKGFNCEFDVDRVKPRIEIEIIESED